MVIEKRLKRNTKPIDVPRDAVACALCGGDDTTLLFEVSGQELPGVYRDGVFHPVVGSERIVRCQSCGLVYVNPRLAPMPGVATYSVEEELAYFQATQAERRPGNEGLLRRLEGLSGGPGRLLDVGCGDGLLLAQARDRGWEPWGLEVSAELVNRIRAEQGAMNIFHGPLTAAGYPPAHFDAVLLVNVIEHLRDPAGMISEITRVTRPGGIVAVHTPNLNGLAARLRGPAWHHYEPLEHFYYFNARTLGRLLEAKGLTVVGPFALYSRSKIKRWLLALSHRMGLQLDNGLGLLARRKV